MKVNKTAIFVEGQTELIFVRDLLMKAYDYQNLYINCFELGSDGSFKDKNSPFGHKSADFYFQIVLVGNDNSVLSAMLRREKWLEQQGFGRIIGLRDMYSADYLKQAGHRMIKNELNEKFIRGHNERIKSQKMFLCFAIMEIEAWILGIESIFEKMFSELTISYISNKLGYDLSIIDPEHTFFKPSGDVEKIFDLVNYAYNKNIENIYSILGHLSKEDFAQLYNAEKCPSFTTFCNCLLPNNGLLN